MIRSIPYGFALGLAAALCHSTSAAVHLAYSNLGTGDAYSQAGPQRISDSLPGRLEQGFVFTAAAGGMLESLEIPIRRHLNPSDSLRQFSLMTDSAGRPGAVVEQWEFVPPSTAALVTLRSVTHPQISAGSQYWIVGHLNPVGTATDYWYVNLQSPVVTGTKVLRASSTDPWIVQTGVTLPAARVLLADAPNRLPSAFASATPSSGYFPLQVSFSGGNSTDPDGTIVSYSWEFGDGTSGFGAEVNHIYRKVGIYTATLTVTDDRDGTDAKTLSVEVSRDPGMPHPIMVIDQSSLGCALQVNVSGATSSDPDGTIIGYLWDFGDGTTATGPVSSRLYATAGTYTLTLTVTDNDGKSDSTSQDVTVNPGCTVREAYSNLATGDGYNPATAQRIEDPGAVAPQELAFSFIAAEGGTLESLEIPLRRLTAGITTTRSFTLMSDDAGRPGTLLEEWVMLPPETLALVRLTSPSRPVLMKGVRYWLVGNVNPVGAGRDFWHANSVNVGGAALGRTDPSVPWQEITLNDYPAARLRVFNAVPPPPPPPTAAELLAFSVQRLGSAGVVVQWQTGVEFDVLGYALAWQAAGGPWMPFRPGLFPAQGGVRPTWYTATQADIPATGPIRVRLLALDLLGRSRELGVRPVRSAVELAIARDLDALRFAIAGVADDRVVLESTTDVANGPWQRTQAITLASDGTGTLQVSFSRTEPARFYRVRLE